MSEDNVAIIFSREYDHGGARITLSFDDAYRGLAVFSGSGTMDGVRAFVRMLDAAIKELGRENKTRTLVDLRSLHSSPIRAQVVLGKWLFMNRDVVDRLAVFGGRAWEMKLARGIMKLARIREVGFYDEQGPARASLGWPAS